MMFPSAVEGHMPFIDKYKQEQINRVIRKADRQRRHSGGSSMDPAAVRAVIAKETKGKSLPALSHVAAGGQRPRFISMPEMAPAQTEVQKRSSSGAGKQHSLLASLKKVFGGKGKSKANGKQDAVELPSTAVAVQQAAAAVRVVDHRGKTSDRVTATSYNSSSSRRTLLVVPGGSGGGGVPVVVTHSRKRSRARTVSIISAVMETIVEQNESACSREQLSSGDEDAADEDESGSSSSSSSSGADSSGRGSSTGHRRRHGCEGRAAPSGDADGDSEGYDSS